MTQYSRILIVIPALNEAQNITQIVNEIQALHRPWDILVVDDGSSDDTAQVARNTGCDVIQLPFHIGIGGAVSLGLLYAYQKHYAVVIRVDADGQHDPKFIDAVVEPVLSNQTDLSVGSRFLEPSWGYHSSWLRRVGIIFFSRLISLLTQDDVTDPTSGFCAFGPRAIQLFSEYYPSDYPEPEAIVIAQRAGLKFLEIPVVMRPRAKGSSSIRYLRTLYYMVKVTLAIVLNYLRPKKIVCER